MNKNIILTAMFALAALTGQAQELKMNEPSFSDYLPLLNAKGYMAYSFDLSPFQGRQIEPYIKEYVNGRETEKSYSVFGGYTFEVKGDKMTIGFMPSDNDSTLTYLYDIAGTMSFKSVQPLRPIYDVSQSKWVYQYLSKPFELTEVNPGQFIPLVLYGSFWWDEDDRVTRFCVDNMIKPDLSSDLLKYVPHFYVFGIKIQ